jgi:hypothetical protein
MRFPWTALARIASSILGGGMLYSVWMAAFLLTVGARNRLLTLALWLLAPILTGIGFAVGVLSFDRFTGTRQMGFLSVLVWPLTGCVLGAAVVYWFGPMLIVFGMFLAGTASVTIMEIVKSASRSRHR